MSTAFDKRWRHRGRAVLASLLASIGLLLTVAACGGEGEEEASPEVSASPRPIVTVTATTPPVTPIATRPAATASPGLETPQPATVQPGMGVEVGIDVEPSGNTATSLQSVDSCIEKSGASAPFDVDIYLRGLPEDRPLAAFSFQLLYDGSVLTVEQQRSDLFLAAVPGSNLVDLSDSTPDSDGLYSVGVVDFSEGTAESGQGILMRFTFGVAGPGTTTLTLQGSALRDHLNQPIPVDEVNEARVAVDQSCP